jgi:hypothetical protein
VHPHQPFRRHRRPGIAAGLEQPEKDLLPGRTRHGTRQIQFDAEVTVAVAAHFCLGLAEAGQKPRTDHLDVHEAAVGVQQVAPLRRGRRGRRRRALPQYPAAEQQPAVDHLADVRPDDRIVAMPPGLLRATAKPPDPPVTRLESREKAGIQPIDLWTAPDPPL